MRKAALRLTPEEELADLQRKHAQLENDRKAYYETSQWTIKQNAATLSGAQARRGLSARARGNAPLSQQPRRGSASVALHAARAADACGVARPGRLVLLRFGARLTARRRRRKRPRNCAKSSSLAKARRLPPRRCARRRPGVACRLMNAFFVAGHGGAGAPHGLPGRAEEAARRHVHQRQQEGAAAAATRGQREGAALRSTRLASSTS